MLLNDSRLYARGMRAAEASVELQVFRGQIHVFQALVRLLPEACDALRLSGAFLAGVAGSKPREAVDKIS